MNACRGALPSANIGPMAPSVCSRRVRPSLSRRTEPLLVAVIFVPSARVWTLSVTESAE